MAASTALRFSGIVLECFDQDVLARVVGVAVPLEEEVALFRAGGLRELGDELAEILGVLGQGTETDVDQNHGTQSTS